MYDGDPSSPPGFTDLASCITLDDHIKGDESDLANQTGLECEDQSAASDMPAGPELKDHVSKALSDNAEAPFPISSDIPSPKQQAEAQAKAEEGKKRYAHHGKRRRRFTEELFRCAYVDKISRSDLVCNSLLWRNRPEALRAHLQEHLPLDQIEKMTDDEVNKWYVEAKRIFLQGIPEDSDMDGDEEDDE